MPENCFLQTICTRTAVAYTCLTYPFHWMFLLAEMINVFHFWPKKNTWQKLHTVFDAWVKNTRNGICFAIVLFCCFSFLCWMCFLFVKFHWLITQNLDLCFFHKIWILLSRKIWIYAFPQNLEFCFLMKSGFMFFQ